MFNLRLIVVQHVCIFFVSYPSRFFHYFPFAPGNMATFHAIGHLHLTVIVDDLRTTVISKHYLCIMFVFQPSSLRISKGVLYDFDNFVSSLLYHIPTTSFQGRQWVVGSSRYCVVADNLIHSS
jgi:hypothetical protein